jgi:uncharacterized cupredoxin-like copper-binding protein
VRHFRLTVVPALALVAAACSAGSSPLGPSTAASPSAPASSSPAATRIEVRLTDALRMEPATMTVPSGVEVTFVVTNAGLIDHEFYLGDEQAQADHEKEMAAGGMTHDEPEGIGVDPGETKELIYTFAQAGESIAGCHVVGHYVAGMKATITVRP